ncbi:histidine kinase [Comamonas testosteroni]|uniref:histidine kinase n=1 Tax=Comamonas testosteroni TaxID=285 RepID=A0A0L7MDA4_COMTE|nr:ATP-binding protein [Comamonas testosteroni]KOC19862.1 histidine kinase [Comamonas testosteroni]KWT70485.1 Sensor protein basS/pmrB [Comamonas testosteroni]
MRSLRVRLLVWLCLALCTLWGGVAAWMFAGMRHELRSVLDDRLIASARMVAGIVHQFKPHNASPEDWGPMLNVVARDGVACEVSMIRSEVHTAPAHDAMDSDANAVSDEVSEKAARPALIPASPLDVPRAKTAKTGRAGDSANTAPERATEPADSHVLARTAGAPSFQGPLPLGFSSITKGGKPWRTYVFEEHGVRIATADRIDVREGLIHGFAYTIILPFVLALLASMVLMWWGVTRGLRPLESLRQELSERPPGDDSPVLQGRQVKELAPLVQTINHLLQRVHRAIERERRWSDDAAHELRTPLTAVKTHVQVAQMAVANAGSQMAALRDQLGAGKEDAAPRPISETAQWQMTRQALERAGEGVEHLQHTLEQLLLLARLDCQPAREDAGGSRAMACGSEPACAWEALEKAWGLAATAIPSGSLRLRWLPQQALNDARLQDLRVAVPQPLLVSALRNLMENALRYGQQAGGEPGDSEVLLGLRHIPQLAQVGGDKPQAMLVKPAGYVEFTVIDHGPGLSSEDCAVATQRFWRKQHQAHGSGLGLAIVQRIAQCSDGELELLPLAQWQQHKGYAFEQMQGGLASEAVTGLVVRLCLPVKSCAAPPE